MIVFYTAKINLTGPLKRKKQSLYFISHLHYSGYGEGSP